MSDSETIDPGALERLEEWGGERLLRQMIRLYLENSPERMAAIRRGFEEGDADAVHRAAHSLKSSAANVGAFAVRRLAQEMEELAEEGAIEEARHHHEPLVGAQRDATEALERILDQEPPQ